MPVETKKERVNMISALSTQGELRYMPYEGSMNQQHLILFMGHMLRTAKQKLFLILENLRVHHGKMVAEWASKHQDKIELFFLPPYAPESNPDEYLNYALKLSVHSGDLPEDRLDIRHKTISFMRTLQRNKDKAAALFRHPLISYALIQK